MTLALILTPVSAHEAWLEPKEFRLGPDGVVTADLRIGQDFKGNTQPYIPDWFERFDLVDGGGQIRAVPGTPGDRPAVRMKAGAAGLKRLVYYSGVSTLKFRNWEKFQSYVTYEGFTDRLAQHAAAGLPQTGFTEAYRRCAKALISVGPAQADFEPGPVGLPLELIVRAGLQDTGDGDTGDGSTGNGGLLLELVWQGKPLGDTQVRVFERRAGQDRSEHSVAVYRTDAKGQVRFKAAKDSRLMISSVHLFPSEKPGLTYESFWANLTLQR